VQQGSNNTVRNCIAYNSARGFKCTGWPSPQTAPIVVSRANGTSYFNCTATNNGTGFYAEYSQNVAYTDCVSNGVTSSGMHPYELRGLVNGTFTRSTGSGASPVIFPCTWSDVLARAGACSNIVVDGVVVVI